MSRSLRARSGTKNYAEALGLNEEDDAGLPKSSCMEVDDDPESDFAPDGEADSDAELAPGPSDAIIIDTPVLGVAKSQKAKGKGKAKAGNQAKDTQSTDPSAFDRPSYRQTYTLPQPSVNHRHKAAPIFPHSAPVHRLVHPPQLFGDNTTAPTNSYTASQAVTERLNRAHGYNVGMGPLWELLEDRGWYKEGDWSIENPGTEASRRPKVYSGVPIFAKWSTLSSSQAASYLPTSSLTCEFGPFENQQSVSLKPQEALNMSQFFGSSKAHVFNAGAPVWALDWCPLFVEDRPGFSHRHFIAVAPLPSMSYTPNIGKRVQRPTNACIQLWTLGSSANDAEADPSGTLRCDMIMGIDSGPALDLKWCPLPSNDSPEVSTSAPRRLGILAGTFEDGTLSIYSVPHPDDIVREDPALPAYVHLGEPAVRIELDGASCWSLDWGNSEVIAVGCTNGAIAVYNVAEALRSGQPVNDLYPSHYRYLHQSGVRALSWVRAPPASSTGEFLANSDPTVIASGGHDGTECLFDIREPSGNVMNRTRDVIPTMPWSPYAGGPVTIDHENTVKGYSVSPSMLGRGHLFLEPAGPVWSAATSDFHPQLAVGSADGTCTIANMLRSPRRGGMVPLFQHRLFQLDRSRADGRLRMLERTLPREVPDRANPAQRAARSRVVAEHAAGSTGAWPADVAVTRVVWANTGLAAAPLLASATASGLCRIDWLEGRWFRNRIPYGGVAGIRMDGGSTSLDDDEEEDKEED